MLTRCCSRNSRDLGVVIGAASYPSVSHTHGYWPQKKKPAISPLSSRAPLLSADIDLPAPHALASSDGCVAARPKSLPLPVSRFAQKLSAPRIRRGLSQLKRLL